MTTLFKLIHQSLPNSGQPPHQGYLPGHCKFRDVLMKHLAMPLFWAYRNDFMGFPGHRSTVYRLLKPTAQWALVASLLLVNSPSYALDVNITRNEDDPAFTVDLSNSSYFGSILGSFHNNNSNPSLLSTSHSGSNCVLFICGAFGKILTMTLQPNQNGTATIETWGDWPAYVNFTPDTRVWLHITVNPINDAPVATNSTLTTDEDPFVPPTGTLPATDIDGPTLTYSIVSNGTLGTATITNPNTGAFTYTPNSDTSGTDTFTFKVNDGFLNSNVATVTVTINPVDVLPVASDQSLTTNEDTPISGTLVATDADNSTLTYSIVKNGALGKAVITNPMGKFINPDTGKFTYTPYPDQNGTDTFTFKVTDKGGQVSNLAKVTVTVNAVNDIPSVRASSPPTRRDNQGGAMVFENWAVFNPGKPNEMTQQVLIYTVSHVSDPSLFVIPPAIDNEGTLTYTLPFDRWGTSTFDVTVQDDGGTEYGGVDLSVPQQFMISVMPYPMPNQLGLFIQVDGAGRGKVTTTTGLSCQTSDCPSNSDGSRTCDPQKCFQAAETATEVTLTPQAEEGSYFSSWGGNLKCGSKQPILMNGGILCIAFFHLQEYPLTVVLAGQGTVTAPSLNCQTNSCTTFYSYDTPVTLQAQPAAGWQFQGWSGDCDSTGQVLMTVTKNCGATFGEYDQDLDQIPTAIEDQGPNQGDGNGDGIPDRQQNNVTNFLDAVNGVYLTLQVDEGCPITNVYGELPDKYPGKNRNHQFPQGLTYFELGCAKSQVTAYYHGMSALRKNLIFDKFGPTTPGDLNTVAWYKYPATFALATIEGKPVVTATYTLIDGQLGDSTGVDGKIVDPAGLGYAD